jgi:hypothetical protein
MVWSYQDDVNNEAGDSIELDCCDRRGNNNFGKEDNGCLDGNNDSVARAGRSVYTIYCEMQ